MAKRDERKEIFKHIKVTLARAHEEGRILRRDKVEGTLCLEYGLSLYQARGYIEILVMAGEILHIGDNLFINTHDPTKDINISVD